MTAFHSKGEPIRMNSRLLAAAALASLCVAQPAFAFGVPNMPKAPSLGSGSPAANDGSAFYRDFTQARAELNIAQLYLAKAFDLKDEVTLLEAEKLTLASGTLDRDGYKKSKELSETCSQKINARIDQGAVLSAEGRQHYQASIPHLLAGTLVSLRLVEDAKALAQSAQSAASSGSMLEKVSLARTATSTALIAKEIPGFVMDTTRAYKKVLSYGQANKIPTPKDATDALGTL